jgi:hypothetical protein
MKNRIWFGCAVMAAAVIGLFAACGKEEEKLTLGGFANIRWSGYNNAHTLETTENALIFTNRDGSGPPDKTWRNAVLTEVPQDHNFSWDWVGENNPNMTEKKAYYIVDTKGYIAFAVSYTLNGVETKKVLLYEEPYQGLYPFTAQ